MRASNDEAWMGGEWYGHTGNAGGRRDRSKDRPGKATRAKAGKDKDQPGMVPQPASRSRQK